MERVQSVESELQEAEKRVQILKQQSSEGKAKEFLAQLVVIREAIDTLQIEINKLVSKKPDPASDVGRIVETIQRLQQILKRDFTRLDFTVKEQGGFRIWVDGLLSRRS